MGILQGHMVKKEWGGLVQYKDVNLNHWAVGYAPFDWSVFDQGLLIQNDLIQVSGKYFLVKS